MTLRPPSAFQARLIWLAVTGLAIALLVLLVVGLLWGVGQVIQILAPVLWPLAIAAIIAYLLDPLVDIFERKFVSRPRAIAMVFAVALLLIAGLFASVVPQLITQTRDLAARVPTYAARLGERIEFWINNPPAWIKEWLERQSPAEPPTPVPSTNPVSLLPATNVQVATTSAAAEKKFFGSRLDQETLQTAASWLVTGLRKAGSWLFGRMASGFAVLAGLALIPVYTFYLLLEKRGISSRWTDYLPVADSTRSEEHTSELQ